MEQNYGNQEGMVGVLVSAIFAFISFSDVHQVVSIIAGAVAIVSGILAARYYYNANKKQNR